MRLSLNDEQQYVAIADLSSPVSVAWEQEGPSGRRVLVRAADALLAWSKAVSRVHVTAQPFGTLPDGRIVEVYAIENGAIELRVITLGGIITSLRVPDRRGDIADVVLGFPTLAPYVENRSYFGAIIGRVANRIAGARFELDGIDRPLTANDGRNHLHGGATGFGRQLWTATPLITSDAAGVTLARISPDGEDGYPGTLRVAVTYLVGSDATLMIDYQAATDAPTIVNLTQHTYFNLAGERSDTALDHELAIQADAYLPVGADLIPTGRVTLVDRTPFDFRRPARLRDRVVDHADDQIRAAGGFDHTFVLASDARELTSVAELRDPDSGRSLHMSTTEPGLQLYTGQQLDGRTTGAYGRVFHQYAGVCLEPQHFPDTPNRSHFPRVILRPGEPFESMTTWRFSSA